MARRTLFLVIVPLLVVLPRPVAAQCDGKIVSAIGTTRRGPSFVQVPQPLRALARGVGLNHKTTTADVIRRFLLLDVGQPCSATRLAESQRILRFQPFLAEATVRAVPDSVGGVRIEVETLDEIATVFSLRLRNWHPRALTFGDGNVAGGAVYAAATLERGYHYRTGAGVQVVAYQAFGRPYTLGVVAHRAPLGGTLTLALGHAFLTDLQHRVARRLQQRECVYGLRPAGYRTRLLGRGAPLRGHRERGARRPRATDRVLRWSPDV